MKSVRRMFTMLLVALVAALAVGCSKDCEDCGVPTAPTTSTCTYSVSPTSQNFAYTGGTGSIAVATQSNCAWTATSNVAWIKVSASGSGNGSVSYTVEPNPGEARTGTITIGGKTVTITQDACPPACSITLNPTSRHFPAAGGNGSFTVTVTGGCAWHPTPDVSWIHITSNQGCTTCNGTVTYTVDRNSGGARTGRINVGNAVHTVTQDGEPSTPGPTTFTSAKTSTKSATATCPAGTTGSPVTRTGTGTGTGTSTVSQEDADKKAQDAADAEALRNAEANAKAALVCNVPPEPCTFLVSPTTRDVGHEGGNGGIVVSASRQDCAWTAVSNASWITITAGASGTGNGSVNYSVAPNTGAARSGTMTIAGQTVTVNQAAAPTSACTFAVQDTPINFAWNPTSNAGVVVSASSQSCTWTVTSNAWWIAITSGASGTGNGDFKIGVAGNDGAARSGTVTFTGQGGFVRTITVNQAVKP